MSDLHPRQWVSVGVAAVLTAAAFVFTPAVLPSGVPGSAPPAAAACPPVEVVFARGRFESAGPGAVGNAFISALRSKTDKSIGVYAVNYPADSEVDVGANDMSPHIQSMAANCPDTRLVLGGYSLGAAVTDVVLAAPIAAFGFKNPLPGGMDQHIAAVALFGNGAHGSGRSPTSTRSTTTGRSSCATAPTCLQSGRPEHVVQQLAAASRQRIHLGGHARSGCRLRRRKDLVQHAKIPRDRLRSAS